MVIEFYHTCVLHTATLSQYGTIEEKNVQKIQLENSRNGLILSFGHFGTAKSFTTGKAGSEEFLKFPMSHEWHIPNRVQVTLFPHDWLSRRGKKKILHDRRSRE